jgi:hypothetical protein
MNQESKNLLTVFENKLASLWQLDGQIHECVDDNRAYKLETRQRALEKEVDDARDKLYAYITQLEQELTSLREKAIEDSWIRNPDRMGGQFTQDEIDNTSNW